MGKILIKQQAQILSEMIARVVARTKKLTDVSDTSVTKHILAAAAASDEELYFQMVNLLNLFDIDKAKGDDLDERAKEIQPGLITRIPAAKGSGTVVFSRSVVSGTISIPKGTTVKTAGGVIFTTTEAGIITPTSPAILLGHGVGEDSDEVPIVADLAGASGTVAADTIVKFGTKPAGVDTVINPSATTGGLDKETDDAFRARIKQYIQSLPRSTVAALENGVLGKSAPDSDAVVRYSKAIEDPISRGNVTLYIDDGAGSAEDTEVITGEIVTAGLSPGGTAVGGETRLWLNYIAIKDSASFVLTSDLRGALARDTDFFLNPASGQIDFDPALATGEEITADYTRFTGLIAECQKIVDGDSADEESYPGLRAAGVLVVVHAPQVLMQNVVASVTVREGYDLTTVKDAVKQAAMDYINSLGISDDVVRAELISRMIEVAGAYDVGLTTPAANVVLLDDELARTQGANVTIS